MLCTFAAMRTKWSSRVLVPVFVLIGSNLAAAAPPAVQEKTDAKAPIASLRDYLPTIRLKALRDTERQAVADLLNWLRWYEIWVEGMLVNLVQRGQIEEEYHRSRLRALRLDADYRDSLDQFTNQFRESEERRRQLEDAAIAPIVNVFQRFEKLPHDKKVTQVELDKVGPQKDAAKLRPGVIKILTESALVRNTALPKRFLKNWEEWKKIEDENKLRERESKNREELSQIRERESKLWEKQRELSDADRQRRETLKFGTNLVELQHALLLCEKQPWKKDEDEVRRLRHRREMIYGLRRVVETLLDSAHMERLHRLSQSWPGLPSVKLKDVDLLAAEAAKAEGTVTSLLKTPDAQLAGKKTIRRIRVLAESYSIEKRLFYLAFALRENLKYEQDHASTSSILPSGDIIPSGLVGPLGPRPSIDVRPFEPAGILKREAALRQAKRQLLQTWIDYQMLRLDLYAALGIAPPER